MNHPFLLYFGWILLCGSNINVGQSLPPSDPFRYVGDTYGTNELFICGVSMESLFCLSKVPV